MVITFTPQKKEKKYILVLVGVLLFILVIGWLQFLKFRPDIVLNNGEILFPDLKEIKIDFTILEHQIFRTLEDLPEIVLPEEIGRQNPFIPY